MTDLDNASYDPKILNMLIGRRDPPFGMASKSMNLLVYYILNYICAESQLNVMSRIKNPLIALRSGIR